jgi:hypothetical protein
LLAPQSATRFARSNRGKFNVFARAKREPSELTVRMRLPRLAFMGWYVRRDGTVSGPFNEADVIKRIADGNITRSAMVREDPAAEWRPIETSMFESAFGASNPFTNPELITPKRPRSFQLGAWVGLVVLGVLFGVLRGYFLGPRTSQNDGYYAVSRLGAIVAIIGFSYVFMRGKRRE